MKKGIFQISVDKKTPPAIKKVKRIGLIAGGSGITPMYQLIKDICKHPDDQTKMYLIFANQVTNIRENKKSFHVIFHFKIVLYKE